MKRYLLLLFLFITTAVYAGTTSTNGYFYLPDVGDTGSSVHTTWTDTQEATDAVIQLNVDHRNDNSQAHSDYLINNGDDVTSGALTIGGSTGIKASGSLGIGKLSSVGNSYNETIQFDLSQQDEIVITSPTSASGLRLQGFGWRPSAETADPCGSYEKGAIFWNATSGYHCFCNASSEDIKMNDNTNACF